MLVPPYPIPPPPLGFTAPSTPMESIVGDIRMIRDATERQMLWEIKNEETKKEGQNGWDKLPDVVQDMILKLLAISDDVLPSGPSESFLKQSKALGVAMVINIELSLQGLLSRGPYYDGKCDQDWKFSVKFSNGRPFFFDFQCSFHGCRSYVLLQ